jgi:hypothetical protein
MFSEAVLGDDADTAAHARRQRPRCRRSVPHRRARREASRPRVRAHTGNPGIRAEWHERSRTRAHKDAPTGPIARLLPSCTSIARSSGTSAPALRCRTPWTSALLLAHSPEVLGLRSPQSAPRPRPRVGRRRARP